MTAGDTTLSWEAIGGNEGGTVSVLAFSPIFAADKTVFAATLAGVHRSTDGGRTWQPSSQGLESPFVDAIAISPDFQSDRTVFIGGREAGVSRSTDGGVTWKPLDFWSRQPPSIAALAISPAYSADGHVFAGADDGIVYRSSNRGRTWNAIGAGLPGSPVLALAVAPSYQEEGVILAATPDGVFRLQTTEARWIGLGPSGGVCQALALTRTFDTDATIFVGTEDAGIFRSTDGGGAWEALNEGLTDLCVNALALSPTFMLDATLFAATARGVHQSRDGGQTWRALDETGPALSVATPPTFTRVRPGPGEPDLMEMERTVLAGTAYQGVFRSTNQGESWNPSNEGLAARLLVSLVVSPGFATDQTLFISSLEEGVARSVDGGATWEPCNDGLPALQVVSLLLSPNFAADGAAVAATGAGVVISRDRGQTWRSLPGPASAQAIAFAAGALLVGANGGELALSEDDGHTWAALAGPFQGQDIVNVALAPSGDDGGRTIVVAASQPPTASQMGRMTVWWSHDDGATWDLVLGAESDSRWVALALPPTFARDGGFFIGIANQVFRPARPTTQPSGGALVKPTWQAARLGRRKLTLVSLAPSPAFEQDRTLFAATNSGAYVSRDGGASWRPLGGGLSEPSIVAVVPAPTYAEDRLVFAAGLGGSIWRLRDQPPGRR